MGLIQDIWTGSNGVLDSFLAPKPGISDDGGARLRKILGPLVLLLSTVQGKDASETMDADGDGVGDNSDAYPNDISRSVIEESSSLMFVLIIVFLCLAGVCNGVWSEQISSDGLQDVPGEFETLFSTSRQMLTLYLV